MLYKFCNFILLFQYRKDVLKSQYISHANYIHISKLYTVQLCCFVSISHTVIPDTRVIVFILHRNFVVYVGWVKFANWGLDGEIVFISFCELICGELHNQHPDACQDIELGSPFINDYGQHLHFQNIAVISSMVLRTKFNYSKNNRNICHAFTYRIRIIWKTTVISAMFLRTEFDYSKNNRNCRHDITYKIKLFEIQP